MLNAPDHFCAESSSSRPRLGSWWIVAIALVLGVAVGRFSLGGISATAADPGTDATETRTAELAELRELGTKIAQPIACTPLATSTAMSTPTPTTTPTVTATPTIVPPIPVGQSVVYRDRFAILVTSIGEAGTPGGLQPSGRFLSITLTMDNLTNSGQWPPFNEWRLVTSTGRAYRVDVSASQEVFGRAWGLPVTANSIEKSGLVFDVPIDSGDVFVLESEEDPTFRIELILESRG